MGYNQKNLPILITEAYFEFKKKAMMWNRSKKIERYQKENDILSRGFSNRGAWAAPAAGSGLL